jgi:hypothetical protein
MRIAPGVVLLVLTQGMAGCGTSSRPTSPTPTVVPTTIGTTSVGTASVTSISANVGSTAGGTEVLIIGSMLASTVTFGGAQVYGQFDGRSPTGMMFLYTPAHVAGTVDVVVSGLNGQSVTLANAFTYALPGTFDFNGAWAGFGNNGQDNLISFDIRNDMLLSVSCDGIVSNTTTVTLSPPQPVTNSEVSFVGDGVTFTGRIVSPSAATGTIRLGECTSDGWYASKQ